MEGSNRFLLLHANNESNIFFIIQQSTTRYHKFYFTFGFTDQDLNEFFMSVVLRLYPTKVYCISVGILKLRCCQIQKYLLCLMHTFC
jgi:hypothetical protein